MNLPQTAEELYDYDGDLFEIYDTLFQPLADEFGPLDEDVLSSPMLIFGVSFMMRQEDNLYVTYEPFHLVETKSREGLRFALFVAGDATPGHTLTEFLTELADWVLDNEIGDGDQIDLADFETEELPGRTAKIALFSKKPGGYGLYRVSFEPTA